MLTHSPINKPKLTGQNKRLYDYLSSGKKIHVFHPAKKDLQIGYLNSRIADLRKNQINIESKFTTVPDVYGKPTTVKLYWIA